MALWNEWSGSSKNYINLKLVATPWPVGKEDAPYFEKQVEFKPTGENFTKVSWVLTHIKPTFTPKKGKMWDIYGFKAYLEDWNEIYVIESTITNASKTLLNDLLNNKGKNLELSLYINKSGYPSSSVRENGNFVEWMFKFKDLDNVKLHTAISEKFKQEEKGVTETDLDAVFG